MESTDIFPVAENTIKGINISDENREIIYFTDTETAVRDGDKLEVLDVNDEKTEIELHPNEELWFIGEKDGFMPSTVKAADIAEITFDRSKTPATPIRYGIITTDQGSFLSPVAFIFYYWNFIYNSWCEYWKEINRKN